MTDQRKPGSNAHLLVPSPNLLVLQEPNRKDPNRNSSFNLLTIEAIQNLVDKSIRGSEARTKKLFERLVHEIHGLRKVCELRKKGAGIVEEEIIPKHPFKEIDKFMAFESSSQEDQQKLNQFKLELNRYAKSCDQNLFVLYGSKFLQTNNFRGVEQRKRKTLEY